MSTIEQGAAYFLQCRDLGFSDAEIIQALQSRGWQTTDISAALMQASAPTHKRSSGTRWLWIILGTILLALAVSLGIVAWLVLQSSTNN